MELADRVGKKYGITGRQICERYLQICKLEAFTKEAITDLRDNVLLDIGREFIINQRFIFFTTKGKEESWLYAFVKPIKAGVLNEPMKPEPERNPTPEASELPQFTDAVPLIEDALMDGRYPNRPFVLYETANEQQMVISFADTARRYLKRPDDAVARGIITKLAWHLLDGWWR